MTERTELEVRERLDRAVRELSEHSAFSVDPCDVAKLIAASDARVAEKLIERLMRGDRLRGLRCVGAGRVLCAFDCAPDRFCLVPPSFLVVVDLRRREVVEIVDPYDPLDVPAGTQTSGTLSAMPAAAGRLAAPLAGALAASTYEITLTVTGVPYKSAQVQRVGADGAAELSFDGDVAKAAFPAGSYEGFVNAKGWPHASYTVSFEPQNGKKWTLPTKTNQRGDGFTTFQFDLPAST